MKANKYISKREHKFLLLVAFIAFVFPVLILSLEIVEDHNKKVSERQIELRYQADGKKPIQFSMGFGKFSFPLSYLLSVFIFIALLKTKRFLLSTCLTLFYFLLILYGIYLRFENTFTENMFGKFSHWFIVQMEVVVNDYDYVIFALALILLFWQISILLRMLIKSLQRKIELP